MVSEVLTAVSQCLDVLKVSNEARFCLMINLGKMQYLFF